MSLGRQAGGQAVPPIEDHHHHIIIMCGTADKKRFAEKSRA